MNYLEGIKTVIFDLDGTIYFKGKPIKGVDVILKNLRNNNINLRFVTNTDSTNKETLHSRMVSYGINIELDEIFTCSVSARRYLEKQSNNDSFLLCSNAVKGEFEHIPKNDTNPDFVVIGDFRDNFSYENLNKAFRFITNGAKIIAMQNSPYFYSADGINLDTGSFVRMLEYAAGEKAIVVGKPSTEFFEMALVGTNTTPQEALVIGDDINTDIVGAKNFGTKSVLVRTGKFTEETLAKSNIKPDFVIDTVAYLL